MDELDDFDTIVNHGELGVATGLASSLAVMACATSELKLAKHSKAPSGNPHVGCKLRATGATMFKCNDHCI